MMFPLLISATGILTCVLVTLIATDLKPATKISEIESTLKLQLIISTIAMTPVSHDDVMMTSTTRSLTICGAYGGRDDREGVSPGAPTAAKTRAHCPCQACNPSAAAQA